jgi:predicted phage tail protein
MVREKFFEKSLREARENAAKIKEPQLKAEVLVVIASASNSKADFEAANEVIGKMPTGEFRSQAFAAIIKRLAQSRRLKLAREMVHSIRAVDSFWKAEAIAVIALYSRQPQDFGEAKKYARKINDRSLMKDILDDIERFESDPGSCLNHIGDEHIEEMIKELVAILKVINEDNLSRAHALASRKSSGYLRAHAFAVMANILAEEIGE